MDRRELMQSGLFGLFGLRESRGVESTEESNCIKAEQEELDRVIVATMAERIAVVEDRRRLRQQQRELMLKIERLKG